MLQRKIHISPTVVELDPIAKDPVGQTVLANAITLTPGTVTLDVHEGKMRVHCLTADGAKDLLSGTMNRRNADLTGS